MNILLYDMASYIQPDLIYYLERAGHHCKNVIYKCSHQEDDDFFEYKFAQLIDQSHYDLVMSTNFFPIVARLCYKRNIKYVSWSYDSPINDALVKNYNYPTNYTFLFDRREAETIRADGIDNVFHQPLAVNTDRLDRLALTREERDFFKCDVSFVGQLYNNYSSLVMNALPDYLNGYLESIIQSQSVLYGTNLIKQMVTEDLTKDVVSNLDPVTFNLDSFNTKSISHMLLVEVTRRERIEIFSQLMKSLKFTLYTNRDIPEELKGIKMPGSVDYYKEMPKAFKGSTINLNITLRSIESGIPLRALDIMGSHGLLLSNWQEELVEYFPNEEYCITYSSTDEAIEKCKYYSRHPEIAARIADAGYEKIRTDFNYPKQLSSMFEIAGIDF